MVDTFMWYQDNMDHNAEGLLPGHLCLTLKRRSGTACPRYLLLGMQLFYEVCKPSCYSYKGYMLLPCKTFIANYCCPRRFSETVFCLIRLIVWWFLLVSSLLCDCIFMHILCCPVILVEIRVSWSGHSQI